MRSSLYRLIGMSWICSLMFGATLHAGGVPIQAKAGMVQYTAAGHLLGFGPSQVVVASQEHALRIAFQGCRNLAPQARQKPGDRASAMARVVYENLWPGISVEYDAADGAIAKSTYRIAAGLPGNPVDRIRLRYNRPVRLDAAGNLIIAFAHGEMREQAPVAWQLVAGARQPVAVRFQSWGSNEVGFRAAYDPRYPLIIDPALIWNSFLGGSGQDHCARGLAVDGDGHVYVGGNSSVNWGSPVRAYSGSGDGFLAKVNPDGSLAWNTFLGGAGSDAVQAIALDSAGHVYAIGDSNASWGAPVAGGAYSGAYDGFVAKLDASGALQWHAFFGSSIGTDMGTGVAADGSGNVYATGFSNATWGAPVAGREFTAGYDGFAVKFNSSGTRVWHAFLGGSSGSDYGYGIAVDGSGNVYVAGESLAAWGTPVASYQGGGDGFAVKLSSSGHLTWLAFHGSSGSSDRSNAIAVDGSGSVFVVGRSVATWGSPVRAFSGSNDAYVVKLDSAGYHAWHAFLGGSGADDGLALALDAFGNVLVAGESQTSWGAPLRPYAAGYDGFAAGLGSSGGLLWNTFLGGAGSDLGCGVAGDALGNVYVAGDSTSTWGAPVRGFFANTDVFAAKLNAPPVVSSIHPSYALAGSAFSVTVHGRDLADVTSVKLQDAKTGLMSACTILNPAGNSVTAGFNLIATPGLLHLVLTKAGIDFIYKSLFTLIAPQSGSHPWRSYRLAKVGNANTRGSLAIADGDRDGDAEVFAAAGDSHFVRLKNAGGAWLVLSVLDAPGENFQQLLVMDGNHDQELELYAASARPQLYQYEWGKTTPSTSLGMSAPPMAAGDANHDGVLEIYAAASNGSGAGILEWRHDRSAWASNTVTAFSPGLVFTSLVVGDADHAPVQEQEVYAAYQDAGGNTHFYQYYYNGSSWNAASLTNPGTGEIKSLAINDLDEDGRNELYVASQDGTLYQMIDMDPGWSTTTVYTLAAACNQIATGDADNDGQDELYSAGQDGHARQFKYNGTAWQALDLGAAGTTLTALAVGDGDNNFQFEVYALGADGYVYQYYLGPPPTPTATITPTLTPTATATPIMTPSAGPTAIPDAEKRLRVFRSKINPEKGEQVRIRWYQEEDHGVTLAVYNLLGDRIVLLADQQAYARAQFHELLWDGRDQAGQPVGSGIYIVHLQVDEDAQLAKVAVVK